LGLRSEVLGFSRGMFVLLIIAFELPLDFAHFLLAGGKRKQKPILRKVSERVVGFRGDFRLLMGYFA